MQTRSQAASKSGSTSVSRSSSPLRKHKTKSLSRSRSKGSPATEAKKASPKRSQKRTRGQKKKEEAKGVSPAPSDSTLKKKKTRSRADTRETQPRKDKNKNKEKEKTKNPPTRKGKVPQKPANKAIPQDESMTDKDLRVVLHHIDDEVSFKKKAPTPQKLRSPKRTRLQASSPEKPPSSSKKPIYANAATNEHSSHGNSVYDIIVTDEDDSYRPAGKRKRKPRGPYKKRTKNTPIKPFKSLVSSKRQPLKPLLLNTKNNLSPHRSPLSISKSTLASNANTTRSHEKSIQETFSKLAPVSIQELVHLPDEMKYESSPRHSHLTTEECPCFQDPTSASGINKTVRLSTFSKGAFSSSTPDRIEFVSPIAPPSSKAQQNIRAMSTPKPISSIKEQVQNCFGFDESENDEVFGNALDIVLGTKVVASPVSSSTRIVVTTPSAVFKKPKAIISRRREINNKSKDLDLSNTILFDDLEDHEEKKTNKNPGKQKSMDAFVKPLSVEDNDHVEENDNESGVDSEEGEENTSDEVSNTAKSHKRKRTASICPTPKRSKQDEEEMNDWERNRSLEFSGVDDFELSFL